MTRKKTESGAVVISGTADEIVDLLEKAAQKPFCITSAKISEGLCNYGYEILKGPGTGDKIPTRKGSALIHEDMYKSFYALDCHLAVVDDAFISIPDKKQPKSMDELEAHELTGNFTVTGFKVIGQDENEGYILIGEKRVTIGMISLETPKISKGSNYTYFEELKEGIEAARAEVEAYMNGKAAPKTEQAEIEFPDSSATGGNNEDFENPM